MITDSVILLTYITVQFVDTGLAIATSSSVYGDYVASRTIDGNTNQQISNCLHTATTGRTEAWLRVDLRKVFSIQSVKFWYRNDSAYLI